jgi:hypothetical protein
VQIVEYYLARHALAAFAGKLHNLRFSRAAENLYYFGSYFPSTHFFKNVEVARLPLELAAVEDEKELTGKALNVTQKYVKEINTK